MILDLRKFNIVASIKHLWKVPVARILNAANIANIPRRTNFDCRCLQNGWANHNAISSLPYLPSLYAQPLESLKNVYLKSSLSQKKPGELFFLLPAVFLIESCRYIFRRPRSLAKN